MLLCGGWIKCCDRWRPPWGRDSNRGPRVENRRYFCIGSSHLARDKVGRSAANLCCLRALAESPLTARFEVYRASFSQQRMAMANSCFTIFLYFSFYFFIFIFFCARLLNNMSVYSMLSTATLARSSIYFLPKAAQKDGLYPPTATLTGSDH